MVNLKFARCQNFILALGALIIMSSCEKDESIMAPDASSEKISLTFKEASESLRIKQGINACAEQKQELIIGQKKGLGEVSIYKSGNRLYVTLSIDDNNNPLFISKSNMFIGLVDNLGVKKNPAPGKFPLSAAIVSTNNTGDKEYTYDLPMSDYALGTLHFVLYAEVVKVETDVDGNIIYDANGQANVIAREGAWGEGIPFNEDGKGSWASYMAYNTNQSCVACDPVFTGVSGALARTQGALNVDEVIFYPFFLGGEAVGNIKTTYTPSGNVNIEFTLTNSDISIEEIAAKVSNSTVNADFSLVTKTTAPNGDNKWLLEFKNFENTIYAAFYVKLDGICD